MHVQTSLVQDHADSPYYNTPIPSLTSLQSILPRDQHTCLQLTLNKSSIFQIFSVCFSYGLRHVGCDSVAGDQILNKISVFASLSLRGIDFQIFVIILNFCQSCWYSLWQYSSNNYYPVSWICFQKLVLNFPFFMLFVIYAEGKHALPINLDMCCHGSFQ